MTAHYDIAKILTISTAHITEETSDALNRDPHENNLGLSVYNKSDYGWFIYISEMEKESLQREDTNMPADLKACFELAIKNDCEWLCLDCDGPEYDELPTYDW